MSYPSIKDLIKDNIVEFDSYRKGFLYYTITYKEPEVEKGEEPRKSWTIEYTRFYRFAVPISDTGDATFKFRDKAIYFMRYINAAIKEGTLELVERRPFKSTIFLPSEETLAKVKFL